MSEIFYSADGDVTKIIENMTDDQYYLDGSLKVSGSVISNKFVNEAGEPIGLPKNVDVKGSLKVRGNTELEKTSINNSLNVNGPVNINKNILKVDEIHIGNVKLTGKNVLKIQNDNGMIEIGAMNKDWGHIYTDRPKFAINKNLVDVATYPYTNYVKYSADGSLNLGNLKLADRENSLRVQNNNGFIDIGTKNKDWGHIYTDRPKFAINKDLVDVAKNPYTNYVKYSADGSLNLGNLKLADRENSLRIQNNNGFIDIGTKNKDWGHIYTDRPKFAINKDLVDINGNYSNYIRYNTDGGIKINDFNLTQKNEDLLVNNSKTNKVSMTIHRDGSVSLINKLQPTPAQTPTSQSPVAKQIDFSDSNITNLKIKSFNIEDAVGIKQGKYNNISFETFGLNSNLNNWTITITLSATYMSSKWQGIIGNMYNSQLSGKIGWGLWINPSKYLHFRIEDWTENFISLGQILENVPYKIIFSFSNNVYKIKLIRMSDNANNIVIISNKPKLTTDRGSICLGGRWQNGTTNELFDGNITSVHFTPHLLTESFKKCDRKDTSYCIFKDYTTTGNGVCNAPSSTGSGFNYAGLNTYNDKPQFVNWLDALYDRNAGTDPNKGERSNVVDFINRCKNEPGYSFLNDTKAAKAAKIISEIEEMKPMGWFDTDGFNQSTQKWLSKNGKHTINSQNVYKDTTTIPFVYGGTNGILSNIPWPGRNKDYTFIHIAKYNGNARGRIWTSLGSNANWLSGFWNGGIAFYHEGWFDYSINASNGGKDWLLSVDMNNFVRVNKGSYQKANSLSFSPDGISVGLGEYGGEKSDFAIVEFLIFDRKLTQAEYVKVEDYLVKKYGLFNEKKDLSLSTPRIYNHIIKNTDYAGNDISYHTNQTIDSCKILCDSNINCAGFLRRNRDNSCWLKTNKVNNPTNFDGLDFYTTTGFNPPKLSKTWYINWTPKTGTVNFKVGNDIALHFNIRDTTTVLDSYRNNRWESGIFLTLPLHSYPRPLVFTVTFDKEFIIKIGSNEIKFPNRFSLANANNIVADPSSGITVTTTKP